MTTPQLHHRLGHDLQHVSAGTYQAAPDVRMPGWKIVLDGGDAPAPTPLPRA
jgi:hypothetical protein